jgi:hypothetical protein
MELAQDRGQWRRKLYCDSHVVISNSIRNWLNFSNFSYSEFQCRTLNFFNLEAMSEVHNTSMLIVANTHAE